MPLIVDKIEGPSFLAVALINGDTSGFSDEDEKTLALFETEVFRQFGPEACVVDCEEETFFGRWIDGLGHDLVEYTVHYYE